MLNKLAFLFIQRTLSTMVVKTERAGRRVMIGEETVTMEQNRTTVVISKEERSRIRKEVYPEYLKEPLREKCIVFESLWGRKCTCNPAALYEYIDSNHPEYECVWFLNDPDSVELKGRGKKILRGSKEYFKYLATAKYLVYNNNLPQTFRKRSGQIIIQTMHGTPFKSFGLDVKEEAGSEEDRMKVVLRSALWDCLIAQGEFTKNMAWRWFRYDKAILETGYPRTDVIYRQEEQDINVQKRVLGLPEDKKVILYAPTWRDMESFDMMLDLEQMRRELSDKYVLLIRPHYFVSPYYKVPEDGSFIFDMNGPDNIEDLFGLTDILITDYSSVMFDFSLTDKPMIFFAYDLEEYTLETRGSYFDISTEAPGSLTRTTEEVIEAVKNLDKHYEINGERINAFRDKYLTYENPDSSAQVFEKVFIEGISTVKTSALETVLTAAERLMPRRMYSAVRKAVLRSILNNQRAK